jgi:predicted nucleic acid-binding protein
VARPSETLICDTSFVSHVRRRSESPWRYAHWDAAVVDRVSAALLEISVVTVAEVRAGYLGGGWGVRRIAAAERFLSDYLRVRIDRSYLDEWARLSVAARARGISLSDNDLWIAATASVRDSTLITCDRDHVRIARDLSVEVVYLQPPV